jgi:hypothetical protein
MRRVKATATIPKQRSGPTSDADRPAVPKG